tara:strand:+ start:2317 stop:3078 length:762 start_codon:yes stop_codon:yes gene_type:complete
MVLLKPQVKKRMSNLIIAGTSINNISRELNLGKSTIYYHYKKIKGRKYKLPTVKVGYSSIDGEIIGIFIGDGSQHFERKSCHYTVNIHFGLKNIRYALYVKCMYQSFFNKKFRLEKSNPGSIRITTYSKEIFNFFKNYLDYEPKIKHCTVKLRTMKLPKRFKIGLLRGLWDTDGCIYNRENRIRAVFYTTSQVLAQQVHQILIGMEIQNSVYTNNRKNRNEKTVYIVNVLKPSVDKFINMVKPLKARTVRGRW